MLKSALLFYNKFVGDLKAYGFELNPYNPCVANKTVNRMQMTVCSHVEDLKISHTSKWELTQFIIYLAKICGDKISVHWGKVYNYLGMILDYVDKGKMKVNMTKFIFGIFKDFPELIGCILPTPMADHLYKVRSDDKRRLLLEKQALAFHHTVAQLLFLCNLVQQDIQCPVVFLTTRVKEPDKDNWGKLKRALHYLKGMLRLLLALSAKDMRCMCWWVGSSFVMHLDCKRQSRGMISLGKGGGEQWFLETEAKH